MSRSGAATQHRRKICIVLPWITTAGLGKKQATNCGYCIPCLFRRAALYTAKLDSGKDYGIDVCKNELTVESDHESANDLRALTSGLRQFENNSKIRRSITSVASVKPVDDYVSLVQRGLDEVRTWIAEKASPKLREAAGIGNAKHA